MYKNFFRYLISAIFLLGFSVNSNADFKVGFVYVGPTGDHGWTFQHHEGRNAVEAAGIKTTFVESDNYLDLLFLYKFFVTSTVYFFLGEPFFIF